MIIYRPMNGMGFSLNPVSWVKAGASAVATGAKAVGSGISTGAKYAATGAKIVGGVAVQVAQNKQVWRVGVMAAGAYFGIPPNVTASVFDAFMKTGKVPPGTDPRLAEYLEASRPRQNWPLIIGASAGGLLLLALVLRRPRRDTDGS